MLSCFAKCFRFGVYLFFISSQMKSTESLVLNKILTLFQDCTIHIYNYRGLPISPSYIPATLYLKTPFQIEPEISNHEITRPVQCQAVIYVLPTHDDIAVSGKRRNNNRGHYLRRRTYIRYDVLVDDSKRQSTQLWSSAYSLYLYESWITSFGLITEIEESLFDLSDKLEIIHMFKVSYIKKLVTTSLSLKQFRWYYQLYGAVMSIHDIRKNKDVQWTLNLLSDGYKHDPINFMHDLNSNIKRVRKMFDMNFASPTYAKLLQPTTVSEEGMENFLFAFTLLGADINLTENNYKRRIPVYMVNPRITFNVPQGTVMMDQKPREAAYVSCATAGGPTVRKYTFQQAAMELISVFEIRIYFALIGTYVAPALVLGLLYHFILKKRIKKEYWVSWHAFAWGLRALIWQAGDRKFNSSRFGWTTFMVVPWLLVAVIISNAFRKNVLSVIGTGGSLIFPWSVLKIQYNSGVTLVTDIDRLAVDLNSNWYADSFDQIANEVGKSDSMTYISWENRVNAVAKLIGQWCPNTWLPVKYRRIHYWNLGFISRYAGMALREEIRGWVIENWLDNGILYRLGILDGESGIFGKWRDTLERINEYQPDYSFYRPWVTPIGMNANILYLFFCGAAGFGLALMIWISEWIFFKVYTQPRRKWKKKMDNVRKIIVGDQSIEKGDSGRGSISSGRGIEEEIVNAAVILVNEQRRSLPLDGPAVAVGLDVDENKEVRTEIDETDVENAVSEIGCLEINTEGENTVECNDKVENMEIVVKVDCQENNNEVHVKVEELNGIYDTIEQEGLMGLRDSCEEIDRLIVEENRSTELTISVTRSESRVSFADPLETFIEPKIENENGEATIKLDNPNENEEEF